MSDAPLCAHKQLLAVPTQSRTSQLLFQMRRMQRRRSCCAMVCSAPVKAIRKRSHGRTANPKVYLPGSNNNFCEDALSVADHCQAFGQQRVTSPAPLKRESPGGSRCASSRGRAAGWRGARSCATRFRRIRCRRRVELCKFPWPGRSGFCRAKS